MSFLPEDDRRWLEDKKFEYEKLVQGAERGIVFKYLGLPAGKFLTSQPEGARTPVANVDVLILIPNGYTTTSLDSFYTNPILIVAGKGAKPQNCDGLQDHFGRTWQFWSRHLQGPYAWRPGIDSLRTFWELVKYEIRRA